MEPIETIPGMYDNPAKLITVPLKVIDLNAEYFLATASNHSTMDRSIESLQNHQAEAT
jgi:hypothetical protein